MKVKVKDLEPNPFRHLERYPIDAAKVERLSQSMKHTGFWDNIVARKKDGVVEIAYGHHRREALRKTYKPNDEVDVIIKDLDDETMIKIMADENDDVYNMTPSVINETVRVARDYLESRGKCASGRTQDIISDFLNWSKSRVGDALADITSMDEGDVVEEAESLPSQRHTSELRVAVKKHKISPIVQKKVIEAVKKKGLGYRAVKDEVFKYIHKDKDESFEELLKEAAQAIRIANGKIKQIIGRRGKIQTDYRGLVLVRDVKELITSLMTLQTILKEGNDEDESRSNRRVLVGK